MTLEFSNTFIDVDPPLPANSNCANHNYNPGHNILELRNILERLGFTISAAST